MTEKEAAIRVEELTEQLLHHQHLYYVKALPEISDREYDALFDELLALEEQFPGLAAADSPTKRVGSDLEHDLPEAEHTIPVLSLDKCYSVEELLQWAEKIEGQGGPSVGFTVEEKLDGSSIVLYYEKGRLVRAVTRGNGSVGNDITDNVVTIASVPLRLPEQVDIAVRGEIFLAKESFAAFNKQAGGVYANPRNLAAGVLRSVRSSSVAKVPLDLFVYEGFVEDSQMEHIEILSYLARLGFKLNPHFAFFSDDKSLVQKADSLGMGWVVGSVADIDSYIKQKSAQREALPYEIDGLVVKVNEQLLREQLGYTAHHPRWAIAYKFEAPRAATKLLSITVQVGRNGRITPVAELEPVLLAGSTISRATLHNQDYINQLSLSPGDQVAISKRGDVIPAVEEVLEKEGGSGLVWQLPAACPTCGTSLVKNGAHHFCPNRLCLDRIKGRLVHFAGKAGLDIDGLGERTVVMLCEDWGVCDISEIFTFDYDQLLEQEGYGEKKIALIRQGLEKSKQQPFAKLLAALGVESLGRRAAELLVKNGFNSMEKILTAAAQQDEQLLAAIDGFGEITANLILKEFANLDLVTQIRLLENVGLPMAAKATAGSVSAVFDGQRWCVTGSFDRFKPRDLAKEEIKKRGGQIVTAVSSKVTHLLAGEKAGSKLKKAIELGVTVVDEKAFLDMLAD